MHLHVASEEEDRGDDFLGADDFPRKKISLNKSKPAKASEMNCLLPCS